MSNKAYAQYSISDIRDGKDGVGILEIEEQYYKSTSNSSQTGGNWSSTQPTWEDGYYIWTRLKITWDNDVSDPEHITYTDPVLATTYQSLHTDVINRINNIATKDENGNWSLTNGVIENTYVYSSEDGDPIALGEIGANITTTKDQILSTVSSTYATTANLNSEANKRKATYVTCSTGAGTKAKIGSCSNFELYDGAAITCVFSNANTQATPTLNVNGTGAKTIVSYDGKALTESEYKWKAGSAYTLVYDGTYWRMQDSGTVARLTTAESSIQQNADNIELKVSESDVTGNYLVGKINLDSTTATISASRVNITGDVIVSKLSDDNKNTISANAISKAEEAIGKAEDAQSDASDAVSTANSANSTAQSAASDASNALGKANSSIKTDTLHYLATSASSGVTKSTSGWTTTIQSVSSTKRYLWTYHTYTKADNTTSDTNPVITGVYGDPGTSVTVNSTSVTYQKGTSGTEKPTGTWGTSIPSIGENEFLWTKTVVNYSDGKSTEAYSVSRNAKNGTNGTSPTVTSTKTQYQQSTDGKNTPTGTWLDSPPTATLGQYMWTKTTITYSDSKTAVSYTVSRNGEKGVGIKSVTPLYYGTNSTTAPAKPTSTVTVSSSTEYNKWNKTCPTWTTTYKYYFTCSEILYDDNTTRTWSDVVRENALETANSTANTANSNASNALDKANTASGNASSALEKANSSIVEQKTLYYLTNGNAPAKPTKISDVSTTSTSSGVWTTVIPDPKNGYTYYTCTQTKNGAGTYAWIGDSNNKGIKMATDSMIANWCSASDSTYINGGSIYANSITSNQLATNAIQSIEYSRNTGSHYSSLGSMFDLADGNIYTKNFGVDNNEGKAYINGEIVATSGTIGNDSGNYWEIGNTTDIDGGIAASIVGNGTAYIQDGDFQIHNGLSNYSNGSINTQRYATVSGGLKITYPYYSNTYYDYGMTSPVLNTSDTSRFYSETVSQNFLYIRKHAGSIPEMPSDWNYIFRVDKDGKIFTNQITITVPQGQNSGLVFIDSNGQEKTIENMITDGVSGGAYLPNTGIATLDGTLNVTGSIKINNVSIDDIYVKKSGSQMSDNGYISRKGKSVSWHKGRDGALIKTTTINAYSPIASLKTTNGSWDIGVYNNSSYYDDLLFTYVTDTLYGGTNTVFTKQIKFLENGHIVADGFDGKATSAGTADSATTATTSTWTTLIKPIADTTTASASTWSIPSGSKQVWGERFSDTTLKYTPSGGSATTITDAGDLVLFLTPNATSNLATLNMKIDGTYYGSFSGNLTGTASSATTATKFSSNRKIELTGDTTGSASTNGESGWSIATTTSVLNGGTALTSKNLNDYHDASGKLHFYYAGGSNSCTNVPIGDGTQFGLITYNSAGGHVTQEISSFSSATNKGKWIRWWNSSSWSNWERFITNAFAGGTPSNIGTTASAGTSENYARQDHVHKIDLATGDSNGQVKIAGSNVSVKGLAALAYKASLAKSDVGLGSVDNAQQVRALSSGTTSGHLVTWGANGYTVADSGIAKGSVTTKITLSGTDYSASSNAITITKANLQSAVQDTSYVLMTAEERSKLGSIAVSSGGTIDFSGVTASAPLTATVNQTTKAVNLTHDTSGVTAGTYRSVTVNTYGHVTGGTNPTTLSGYGITDAKIASGTITLGSNTITPLTAASTIAAGKVSGTVAAATKATQDSDGKTINTTYLKVDGSNKMTNLLTLYREGTTDNNYPAGIQFSVKDTTTGVTDNNASILVYEDHKTSAYGTNMVIRSGGGMFLGSGESPTAQYNAKGSTYDGEDTFITSDQLVVIQSNGNTIANRLGFYLDTYHNIIPCKADTATDNIGSIGTSAYKWANMYATTFHGALDGNASTATTAGNVTGVVAVANGGTGKTTEVGAANTLLSALPTWTADPTDTTYFIRQDTAGANSFGRLPFSTVWNYIKGKVTAISDVFVKLSGDQTVAGTKTFSSMILANAGIAVNNKSSTAGGIGLYSTVPENYGIAMRATSNLGKHGYVQGDWAIYNCMSGSDATNKLTRGWIWRNATDNVGVASISGAGNAVFNGSVTIGGNTENTSGARMEFNSTTKSIDFIFN